MKSLLEKFQQISSEQYDYYCDPKNNLVMLSNPFLDNNFNFFVSRYFLESGKERAINFSDLNVFKGYDFIGDNNRAKHVCSVYFLGIIIYENFKTSFFSEIEKSQFLFLWFLTCLYHDYFFSIERDSILVNKIADIDSLRKEFKICHLLLDRQKIPKTIDVKQVAIIRNYFIYRRFENRCIDHGITAGIILFDRLEKNRRIQQKNKEDSLDWSRAVIPYYVEASYAIALHNIWFATCDTRHVYAKYDILALIDAQPIKVKNSPLLFLLGLVDTLDPIKSFLYEYNSENKNGYSVTEILEKLNISFTENSFTIENAHDSKLDFSILNKKADSLVNWLDVKLNRELNRLTVTIL